MESGSKTPNTKTQTSERGTFRPNRLLFFASHFNPPFKVNKNGLFFRGVAFIVLFTFESNCDRVFIQITQSVSEKKLEIAWRVGWKWIHWHLIEALYSIHKQIVQLIWPFHSRVCLRSSRAHIGLFLIICLCSQPWQMAYLNWLDRKKLISAHPQGGMEKKISKWN